MSTAEDNDTDSNSNNKADDIERNVGGAETPLPAELVPPPPPITPQPSPRSLDKRLNPNAPVFIPQCKAEVLAAKLFDSLGPYTRWSTASSEDISYGPRFDSIWREFSVEQLHSIDPVFDGDSNEEMVDLELDEHQAMNIGAESYDPKLSRSASNPMAHSDVEVVIDIVGDVQPQLEQSQDQTPAEERNDSGKPLQPRYAKIGRRCCIIM
ncbi:hypothetical protein KR059_009078 [Drosophila kikkawai]|nr:hypothetical protein KR059_009078 [Drosophila kikkawai]